METAHPSAQPDQDIRSHDRERKCLVTGDVRPKDQLIRFVLSPDDSLVPDLAQNLPGRGMWVTATHQAITDAVKKNLFSRAAKTVIKAPADLADQTALLLRKRCLNFLGLARSAGIAVLGQALVEAELKANRIKLLLIADKAGRDVDKLAFALETVTVSRLFSRNELGSALGHDQLVYIGFKSHALTTKLRDNLSLLAALTPTQSSSHPTETDNVAS